MGEYAEAESRKKQIERISQACHEVNTAYCLALGDTSHLPWDRAPESLKNSVRAGVELHLDEPETTPAASHESWLFLKKEEGWKYGPVKDIEKKEHPCFMPYDQLPAAQRAKDYIFKAVVKALR